MSTSSKVDKAPPDLADTLIYAAGALLWTVFCSIGRLDEMLKGLTLQPMQEIDNYVVEEVSSNHMADNFVLGDC